MVLKVVMIMRQLKGFYVCEWCGGVVDYNTAKESQVHTTYGCFIICESCGDKFIKMYNELRGDDDDT